MSNLLCCRKMLSPCVGEPDALENEWQASPAMLATLWAEHGVRAKNVLSSATLPHHPPEYLSSCWCEGMNLAIPLKEAIGDGL